MTFVYANPDRWAVTLLGWDNRRPLSVGLLPDGSDHFTLAAGWTVEAGELIGDQYQQNPWRTWVVRNMMVLPGGDYQRSGSARYWSDPAKVQAEVDEIAAEQADPPAELHVPLVLLRSAKLFTPPPSAPDPPEPSAPTAQPEPASAPRRGWRR